MLFLFSKVMVTALVVVAVSEIAQRSDKWGGADRSLAAHHLFDHILDVF